jgi:hypothetical protein
VSAGSATRGGARYPDSEEGARGLIMDMTAFAAASIMSIEPHPSVSGCWIVTFPRRKLRAYVGDHPLAPDFELVKDEPKKA